MLTLLWIITLVFLVVLVVRMAFDWIKFFATKWVPAGPVGLVHDTTYGVTTPAIRFVRKGVPPLKITQDLKLDLAFLILVLLCSILLNYLGSVR